MIVLSRHRWRLLLLTLVLGFGRDPARGQGQRDYWFFGNAAVHFTPSGPVAIPNPHTVSQEGCSTVSDAAGNLLFFTDGSTIWDRQYQPMPNGTGLGLPQQLSSTQGALSIQDPGDPARYYVFRQAAFAYPNGLGYVVVDMRLRGGLGDVVGPLITLDNASPRLAEKLTGIVHANGRDTWVLTHGIDGSTLYYAYLVSPAGVSPVPVTTAVGLPHGTPTGMLDMGGYLRSSPSGLKLAAAVAGSAGLLELLDFDPATGRPGNPITLAGVGHPGVYGLEFSPDGSKLYATDGATLLYQYDLLSGANVAASRVLIGRSSNFALSLLRGPDDRLYLSVGGWYLGIIPNPNVPAPGCGFVEQGLPLTGPPHFGLPNFPNDFPGPGHLLARISSPPNCLGTTRAFTATLAPVPFPAGATYAWTFGDPAAGAANLGQGPTASHTYTAAGTYLVSLRVSWPAGGPPPLYTTTLVTVAPIPALSLAPRARLLCAGQSLLLDAGAAQPGLSYRWQDGSRGPTLLVTTPGTYRLQVSTPEGCEQRDSVVVSLAAPPPFSLGPDTLACDHDFPVQLRPRPLLPGLRYRWPDGSTAGSYGAPGPGLYRVEATNTAGCLVQAEVRVTARACPVLIPNIISPDGDGRNDAWVLEGLTPAEWSVRLYSRWGRQVFAQESYDNGWQAPGLAAGIYYYRLQHHRSGQHYQGWVEVVR